MNCKESNTQTRILFVSALMAAGFASSGLALGLAVDSMAIFFDGLYSLVSLALTLVSLVITRYIGTAGADDASDGGVLLEQLAILAKALMILAVAGYSTYTALMEMMAGGHLVNTSMAVVFEAACACGCAYACWYMGHHGRRLKSGLVNAEMQQWKMDTLLSLVCCSGFMLAWALEHTTLARFSGYADPTLMLIMSYYFIKIPVQMIRDSVRIMLALDSRQVAVEQATG